jgi:tRNA(Ile)-lysidine synthase
MQELYNKIIQHTNSLSTVCVACSGGVDSMFLTRICSEIIQNKKIFAIIINHNLQESSKKVANDTLKTVNSWGVNGIVLEWLHGGISSSLEELARNARYSLITEFCIKNNIKSVMLAHHIDDKIETFLMNAMRGTGLKGLTSMQEFSEINGVQFFRPMISCIEKSQIIEFMIQYQIQWFEDWTNQDTKFTRNNIRHSFEFTTQQKTGILKTIQNLDIELIEKKKTFP